MDLDDLEDLFDDLDFNDPSKEQLYEMYGCFLNDIARNPIIINGIAVKYNNTPSKHPICRGKAQAFEHIITRESKISGKRNFDCFRANKIHWIRPIIENVSDPRIKYFERINDKNQNQLFYWYSDKSFIIIVRVLNPDYLLITAFCIDNEERRMYKQWYEEYKK